MIFPPLPYLGHNGLTSRHLILFFVKFHFRLYSFEKRPIKDKKDKKNNIIIYIPPKTPVLLIKVGFKGDIIT